MVQLYEQLAFLLQMKVALTDTPTHVSIVDNHFVLIWIWFLCYRVHGWSFVVDNVQLWAFFPKEFISLDRNQVTWRTVHIKRAFSIQKIEASFSHCHAHGTFPQASNEPKRDEWWNPRYNINGHSVLCLHCLCLLTTSLDHFFSIHMVEPVNNRNAEHSLSQSRNTITAVQQSKQSLKHPEQSPNNTQAVNTVRSVFHEKLTPHEERMKVLEALDMNQSMQQEIMKQLSWIDDNIVQNLQYMVQYVRNVTKVIFQYLTTTYYSTRYGLWDGKSKGSNVPNRLLRE